MNELISLLVKLHHKRKTGQTSIAWLKEQISQHYTTEKGKQAILLPAPKKSFLDSAPNRL
jgi:hypothetical protein